ncbi:MAG: hypothetical protein LC781_05205 [Actinobacteria bacterium]|nr:hypothetical protein [Actinomycetota bacterium]
MIAQLEVPLGEFNVAPEGPEDGHLVTFRDLSPVEEPTHLESALPPALARHVVEEALSLTRPVRCRLTVEGGGETASLDVPLEYDPEAVPEFRLRTPDGTQGIRLVLNARPDEQATLNLDVRYAGLPVDRALSYARFLSALYRKEGTLYLTRLEPEEEKFELLELPLPLDPVGKSEVEDRLRLLEALDEIGRATGAEIVYPEEIEDEDLREINHVLKAIRSGWVAQRVSDFATPLTPESVKNLLELVDQEGEVSRAFYQENGFEIRRVLNVQASLGPSRWYISGARLQTTRAEMEEWLASKPRQGDSFEARWVPVDDVLVHFFYPEWPKPSLDVVGRNLEAFEEEYGMDSEEFRRAWETGEPRARSVEEGDIWISFLEAQEALEQGD